MKFERMNQIEKMFEDTENYTLEGFGDGYN